MNQHSRQNSNQWFNNFGPMKSKSMGMGPQCNVDRSGFRNNPMMMSDALNSGPGGPPPGVMNMPSRLPMWNQQVILFIISNIFFNLIFEVLLFHSMHITICYFYALST